jgi:DNA-binding NtrC family response regulator
MNHLLNYDWPGNVRELENVVERALILNRENPFISTESLITPKSHESPAQSGSVEEALKLDVVVSKHIRKVLELTNGRVHGSEGTAHLLGINPSTLRKRMTKLGIDYGRRYQNRKTPASDG